MEFVRLDDCQECAYHRSIEPTPIPGWARHLMHLTERNHRAMTDLATALTDLTTVVTDLKDALPTTHDQVGNQIETIVVELRGLVDGLKAVPTVPGTAPAAPVDTPAPVSTPPVPVSTPEKPLYEHVGGGVIDTTEWPPAGTDPAGVALYTFAGDPAGGPAMGTSAEWTVYTPPAA
jgi:hypothetical protein